MPTKPKQSPFQLALAARKKEIAAESLTGAARKLFRDASLSNEDLTAYSAQPTAVKKPITSNQPRSGFKY